MFLLVRDLTGCSTSVGWVSVSWLQWWVSKRCGQSARGPVNTADLKALKFAEFGAFQRDAKMWIGHACSVCSESFYTNKIRPFSSEGSAECAVCVVQRLHGSPPGWKRKCCFQQSSVPASYRFQQQHQPVGKRRRCNQQQQSERWVPRPSEIRLPSHSSVADDKPKEKFSFPH